MPLVTANESRLGQVVLNLDRERCSGHARGRRRTETCSGWPRERPRTGSAAIEVSDTGCGISKGRPRADLRSFLHDEAGRRRHGSRSGNLPPDRAGARWNDRGGQRGRRRERPSRDASPPLETPAADSAVAPGDAERARVLVVDDEHAIGASAGAELCAGITRSSRCPARGTRSRDRTGRAVRRHHLGPHDARLTRNGAARPPRLIARTRPSG